MPKQLLQLIFFFFFSFFLHAGNPESLIDGLFAPAFCRVSVVLCPTDQKFLIDQNGRCGCLSGADYSSPGICRENKPNCSQSPGKTYSDLYQPFVPTLVGCGCYPTIGPMTK